MELISTQKANKKVCSIEAHKKVKCKSTLKYHLVGFKASSDGSASFHAHLVYQYQILGLPITYMGQFESHIHRSVLRIVHSVPIVTIFLPSRPFHQKRRKNLKKHFKILLDGGRRLRSNKRYVAYPPRCYVIFMH